MATGQRAALEKPSVWESGYLEIPGDFKSRIFCFPHSSCCLQSLFAGRAQRFLSCAVGCLLPGSLSLRLSSARLAEFLHQAQHKPGTPLRVLLPEDSAACSQHLSGGGEQTEHPGVVLGNQFTHFYDTPVPWRLRKHPQLARLLFSRSGAEIRACVSNCKG